MFYPRMSPVIILLCVFGAIVLFLIRTIYIIVSYTIDKILNILFAIPIFIFTIPTIAILIILKIFLFLTNFVQGGIRISIPNF